MKTASTIDDTPLPLNQNFRLLKEIGLDYIQENSGEEWTNLNSNDPGVTILDQLCYALTELGYCNGFPIDDILTNIGGQLQIEDQFYMPEEILTTSPVTIQDYIKYLIDGVDGVKNAIVIPSNNSLVSFVYQVYLYIDLSITEKDKIKDICKAAFLYLNKSRNIGGFFLMPLALKKVEWLITGNIDIENEAGFNGFMVQIEDKIRDFVFPSVLQKGYGQMIDLGINTNDIFNGPVLQKGWIQTSALGKKEDILRAIDVENMIETIPGVIAVSNIAFHAVPSFNAPSVSFVNSNIDEILVVSIIKSIASLDLKIYCKGKLLSFSKIQQLSLGKHGLVNLDIQSGISVNYKAILPKGNFRDIETYYSIQNTFPEIFAVGSNAFVNDTSDFKIAQSRQLIGYLTLFDQVLANQFSQLANIGQLFSFKNSLISNLSAGKDFENENDDAKTQQKEYPGPYKKLSPTYFYQALYNIPNIKPLLKGNDAFNVGDADDLETVQQEKNWTAYQQDPYNQYVQGLVECMGDEANNLARRNNLLNHLLARHGESPYMVDAIIDAGSNLNDNIIFKSLYLQNLGLLSYNKQKAYNFIGSSKISETIMDVSPAFIQEIFGNDSIDLVFDFQKIDENEKLTACGFIKYSAIELKLNLLFGLKTLYANYISSNYDTLESRNNIKLAMWMILQRKGLLFIETGLLQLTDTFKMILIDEIIQPDEYLVFNATVQIIFPDFIPQLNSDEFKIRLDLFLQSSLPVQVTYSILFVNSHQLEAFIPAYSIWHNSLLSDDKDAHTFKNKKLRKNAKVVTGLLKDML